MENIEGVNVLHPKGVKLVSSTTGGISGVGLGIGVDSLMGEGLGGKAGTILNVGVGDETGEVSLFFRAQAPRGKERRRLPPPFKKSLLENFLSLST